MKRYKFEKDDDVRDFLEELMSNNMNFHLDDDPEDINWSSKSITPEMIYLVKLNMIDLWKYCDPWQVMSNYPETESRYIGEEPK
jgi:hypothetical protein